jgi:hypothetical protein
MLQESQETGCKASLQGEVGEIAQAEQELDDAIRELQTLAALAEDRGDIGTAMELSRRMAAAIKSRTPEHVARLDAEALERVQELTFDGPWVQEVIERSGAYFDVPARAVRRRVGGML